MSRRLLVARLYFSPVSDGNARVKVGSSAGAVAASLTAGGFSGPRGRTPQAAGPSTVGAAPFPAPARASPCAPAQLWDRARRGVHRPFSCARPTAPRTGARRRPWLQPLRRPGLGRAAGRLERLRRTQGKGAPRRLNTRPSRDHTRRSQIRVVTGITAETCHKSCSASRWRERASRFGSGPSPARRRIRTSSRRSRRSRHLGPSPGDLVPGPPLQLGG